MNGAKASQGRRLAAAGALVAGLATCAYLVFILMEGNNTVSRVVLWAGAMAVGAVFLCVAASVAEPRTASWFALGGSVLLAGIGVLSLFSVGLALLAASALGLAAAISLRGQHSLSGSRR